MRRTIPAAMTAALSRAEVVLGKIEHLTQIADRGADSQVHAGQAQHRLVNHTQTRLDRRARRRIQPPHPQVDGYVQNTRPLRIVHPQKKNVAPATVRQIHPHRRPLPQQRKEIVSGLAPPQFRPDAERLVGRMPGSKHPLVAADERTLRRTWLTRVWKPSW